MPNTTNKLHINDTVLFKQVASVLGKGKALEELLRAYKSYEKELPIWYWEDSLAGGFIWQLSEQGYEYWCGVNDAYNKQINNG